jgi:hypothetical protein
LKALDRIADILGAYGSRVFRAMSVPHEFRKSFSADYQLLHVLIDLVELSD